MDSGMRFWKTTFLSVLLCVVDVALQALFVVATFPAHQAAGLRDRDWWLFGLGSAAVLAWFWLVLSPDRSKALYGLLRFAYTILLLCIFMPTDPANEVKDGGLLLLGMVVVVFETMVLLEQDSATWLDDDDEDETKGTLSAVVVDDYTPDQCSICFDELVGPCARLQCGHVFHLQCAAQWYQVQRSGKEGCALCRAV